MENQNSVAFISKIKSISPIEGADKIELANVEGWTSIVQKDIHQIGDAVLCVTTDAVIPENLAKEWGVIQYLRKGNRVRTVKLKGVYSECILIPVTDLDYFGSLGADMMNLLDIHKYEPPSREEVLSNGKKVRVSQNPNFPIYYKFPNAKNVKNMFQEEDLVVITRKIHGTNARYGIVPKVKFTFFEKIKKFFGFWNEYNDYEFVYGSHNVQKFNGSLGYYDTNYWNVINIKYNIEETLWDLFKHKNVLENTKSLIIYGEIYGPGIQGNSYTYGKNEIDFAGFDVIINNNYLDQSNKELIFKYLNLPIVDKLFTGNFNQEIINKFVLNNFIEGTKIPHEGVVVSDISGDRSKICKYVNPDYLIYSEKNNIPDSH